MSLDTDDLPSREDADASPYRVSESVRARFGEDEDAALAYTGRYVDFVTRHVASHSKILDVGCGAGWSTFQLRRLGHDARGLDLHDGKALEVDIPYTSGDAHSLPFPDGSFDAVALHQVVEHFVEPGRALAEAIRVLRRGGRLILVSPNLESLALALYVAATRSLRAPLHRRSGMQRHPYGDTFPEMWGAVARCTAALVATRPRFKLREPDALLPFKGDNDATWYCNPRDLIAWARATNLRALRWWSDRRMARLWWAFAAGTWLVVEREDDTSAAVQQPTLRPRG